MNYDPDGGALANAQQQAMQELSRRREWLIAEAKALGVTLVPGPVGGLWPKMVNGSWLAVLSTCISLDGGMWGWCGFDTVPADRIDDPEELKASLQRAIAGARQAKADSESAGKRKELSNG